MTRNIALAEEQQYETSFCETEPSSQNKIAIPAVSNSVVRVSESSSSEEWTTSDEDDNGKQVAEVNPQSPTESRVQVNNTYSGCTGVNATVNNTTVYKDGATVNNNYFCCSVSLDYVVKWCTVRRILVISILTLLGISLITILGVCLSNLKISRQRNDIMTETVPVIVNTEKIPRNTTTGMPIVLNDPANCTATLSNSTNLSNGNTSKNSTRDLNIIKRKCWGALSPTSSSVVLEYLPPKYVIFSDTETETCTTTKKCMEIVRNIQAAQMKDGLDDIAYNFLIGGDGMVYEGRGWDVHPNYKYYDTEYFVDLCISVSFIGKFDVDTPTKVILHTAKTFLEFGSQNYKLVGNPKLKCLREFSRTKKSPGDKLYKIIRTWNGYDNRTSDAYLPVQPYDSRYYENYNRV